MAVDPSRFTQRQGDSTPVCYPNACLLRLLLCLLPVKATHTHTIFQHPTIHPERPPCVCNLANSRRYARADMLPLLAYETLSFNTLVNQRPLVLY